MRRNWHHWETWECIPAGMYETHARDGSSQERAISLYREFLADLPRFEGALVRVIAEWPVSCEQFLSNIHINRIAWLGQASMALVTGIPSKFRAGFATLDSAGQAEANAMADKYLRLWEGAQIGTAFNSERLPPPPTGLRKRIAHYVALWERRSYERGIPDEVPSELMRLNLAPSHKAIALAILKNDHHLTELGYSQPVSPWYNALKRVEIEARNANHLDERPPGSAQLQLL